MGFLDQMTELVAGREWAEQNEVRRLEKQYSGVEKKLSEVKVVSFEAPADFLDDRKSSKSRAESLPSTAPRQGTLRRGRPMLERSQSELPEPKRPVLPSPSGPPDITAIELNPEQLKRTYSHDNVWDAKKNSLPPLPQMVGTGFYRRAVDASIDWEVQRLHRRNHGMHGSIADRLSELPALGIRPEALAQYRAQSLRSDSFASSKSSRSERSDDPMEEKIDPKTGERISRGFVPSAESSAASSFKEYLSHSRKNSSLSMTSLSGDAFRRPTKPSPRKPTIRTSDSTATTALNTIDEVNWPDQPPHRKVAKPCDFDKGVEEANAAVFDDSGDESDTEEQWLDMASQSHGMKGSGILGQKPKDVEGGKAGAQVRKNGIERSNTVKPLNRPNPRRVNSRNTKPAQAKGRKTSTNEHGLGRRSTMRRAHHRALEPGEGPADGDKSSGESALYMLDNKGKAAPCIAAETATILTQTIEKTDEEPEDDAASIGSDSTALTSDPGLTIRKSGTDLPRSRRSRSGTAIRLFSGNVPVVIKPIVDQVTAVAESHKAKTAIAA